MKQAGRQALWGAAMVATILAVAAPALSFEIFGIRLWGSDEEEVAVIDPLPYSVSVTVRDDGNGVEDAVRTASGLWRDRDEPASGFTGLLAAARGDYRRILAALYELGYYGPVISIAIAGREASELGLDAAPASPVPVAISVDPGPRFAFGAADLVNPPPWPVEEDVETGPASVGYEVGEPAGAGAVTAASTLAIERWRQLSHAKARETEREIIADHLTSEVEAVIVIDPGRAAVYGPIEVTGSRRMRPDFTLYMADLEPGERFDPDDIDDAQARLGRLGVFRSIRIEEGDVIGPDGRLPMRILVEDRLPRTFGVGATLSTLDGAGFQGFWLHRNLFGRAEQLRFDASVAGIGSSGGPEDFTYEGSVTFIRPGVIEPNTNFVASIFAIQQDLETYRETAFGARAGLSRAFGTELTGDAFFEVRRSEVEDDLGEREFLTLGTPVELRWDRRDDAVDATEGFMLGATVTPFYEAEFGNAALRGTLEARAYRGFGEERRFVLAGRAQVGSYVGPSVEQSPPDVLFFAGGGGSVRGYEFRSIGVEQVIDGEDVVVGGKSLIEASGEVRYRFRENWGGVAFLDAGRVGAESSFSGDADVQLGAGLGVRYYTGFGPLRVDVATPLDARSGDSTVAVYIGLGQAF